MKNQSIFTILKEIEMFSSLKEEELMLLERISCICNYKQDSSLFLEGEMSDGLMILIDGIVSIFKHSSKGDEIVIGYFTRYALLAEAPTLRHTPFPSSARFQSDGAILKIDILEFEKIFISHPNISQAIIHSLLQKIDLLQQNIHFKLAQTSKEKILYFYQKNPTLSLDLKQYEIASILGIATETFSRNIKNLIKEGQLIKNSIGYQYIDKEKKQ